MDSLNDPDARFRTDVLDEMPQLCAVVARIPDGEFRDHVVRVESLWNMLCALPATLELIACDPQLVAAVPDQVLPMLPNPRPPEERDRHRREMDELIALWRTHPNKFDFAPAAQVDVLARAADARAANAAVRDAQFLELVSECDPQLADALDGVPEGERRATVAGSASWTERVMGDEVLARFCAFDPVFNGSGC